MTPKGVPAQSKKQRKQGWTAMMERGSFRLWLVLSLLWIGVTGWTTYTTLPPYELSYEEVFGLPPASPPPPQTNWGLSDEEVFGRANAVREERITTGVIIALVPPVLVFIAGAVLIWAELVGVVIFAAVSGFVLILMYGIVVIIFRSAFGVELWNPFR